MTALITGANGFIGQRLLGPKDLGLTRSHSVKPQLVRGDLFDFPSLVSACEGVDTVFHCAGYAHAFKSSDTNLCWRVNYDGTCNLMTAAAEAGVRRFVFLSSVKAMAHPGDFCADEEFSGEPVTDYGKSKRAAENVVLEVGAKYGMHVVNLRLAMVYGLGGRGNLERMARAIQSGWFPPLPETGNRRSLVHIQDVVEVVRMVAERPESDGRTYIIADKNAYSGRQIYEHIRAALGLSTKSSFEVPESLLRTAGRLNNRLGEVVDRLIGSECYSPARIELELGWQARVNLSAGLREMFAKTGDFK